MPANDPLERSLAAKVAAHESWQKTQDRSARTAKGRAAAIKAKREALRQRLLAEYDGDELAVEHELHAREAKAARARLAAARTRRQLTEAAENAGQAEEELRSLGLAE